MASNWIELTLDEVCIKITDGAHKSPKSVEYGKPMASVKDLEFYGLNLKTARHISQEDYEDLVRQGCKPEVGDVLISKDGNSALDTVCTFEEDADVVLLSSVAILRPNFEIILPRFLKYYFLSPQTIEYLKRNFISGAAIPRVILRDFKKAEILLPPLPEQKAIAHILGTLDDKIELNRQMNETLEAMAQAVFKSWFVDFDPVIDNALLAGKAIPEPLKERAEMRQAQLDSGKVNINAEINSLFPSEFEFTEELGWIPKGWIVSAFGIESEFSNGYAFKSKELSSEEYDSYHVFKMGHIKRGGGFNSDGTKSYYPKANASNLDRYLLQKGDILMAMTDMKSSMALLGHTALMPVNNKYLLNQRVGRLRVSDNSVLNYPYIYIYSNLQTTIEEIRSRSNSGVQVNLSTSEIKATPILVPNKETHDLFDKVAVDLFNKIFANDNSSDSLAKLRDTLLPKLMSGELRIPDAEKLVQEAL